MGHTRKQELKVGAAAVVGRINLLLLFPLVNLLAGNNNIYFPWAFQQRYNTTIAVECPACSSQWLQMQPRPFLISRPVAANAAVANFLFFL